MFNASHCRHTLAKQLGSHFTIWLVLFGLAMLTAGCQRGPGKEELPPPEVTVAAPLQVELIDYVRVTGRTEPVEQVEIRARVSGYLTKIDFKPGAEVEKGQPLFEIDARPYQAALESAEAEVTRAEARVERLTAELERARVLLAKNGISKQDFDKAVADLSEGNATVKYAKTQVVTAKLDVAFTKINAPIAGVVGDWLVTEGNLVTGGQGTTTLLTTIVAVDPMDAAFDLDENTLQGLQKDVREGRIKVKAEGEIPVEMGLSVDGIAFPFHGTINFVNNRVDPKTGTIRVKARFPNPKPAIGGRPLTAGVFARLRVPVGTPRKVLTVPESSLGTDQGSRYLFVIDDKNTAVRLEVKPGSLENGRREIISVKGPGDSNPRPLRADERVIVVGLQRVRPGMTVDPQESNYK
jgi:membrane fusion protein, multidrug efflux system